MGAVMMLPLLLADNGKEGQNNDKDETALTLETRREGKRARRVAEATACLCSRDMNKRVRGLYWQIL